MYVEVETVAEYAAANNRDAADEIDKNWYVAKEVYENGGHCVLAFFTDQEDAETFADSVSGLA